MTDKKGQSDPNNRSEEAASEESGLLPDQRLENTANAAAQPGQRVAPGRRPLFRS